MPEHQDRFKEGRACMNPVWPCAMTGAVSCLSGFDDLGIVIHGSSGCFFYPATIMSRPLSCTFLVEEEIIMGTEERLSETISEAFEHYPNVAVVNTCVPAVIGEDFRSMDLPQGVFFVDSPGFMGNFETGHRIAIEALKPEVDDQRTGVNIDGITRFDPFHKGNLMEAERLLSLAGIRTATVFSAGSVSDTKHCSDCTIGTNPDLRGAPGRYSGGLLGISEVRSTFSCLSEKIGDADTDPVFRECERAEELIGKVCDKYLRKYDPPVVAIFGFSGYSCRVADILRRSLDAGIAAIGWRNEVGYEGCNYSVRDASDMRSISGILEGSSPDLVIGSSYEHALSPGIPFVGITPPLRGVISLHSCPLCGIEGELWLVESVLNACMSKTASGFDHSG